MVAGLLAGALLVLGCGKNAPSSETPGEADAGATAQASAAEAAGPEHPYQQEEEIADYELELDGYEDAMLAAGYELPGMAVEARTARGKTSAVAATAGNDPAGPRCERICGLSSTICGLRERICELSDQHGRTPRYAQACERSTLDCERATEACEGCED